MAEAPLLSEHLRTALDHASTAIPAGKTFQAGLALTRQGLGVEAAYKPKGWLTLAGTVERPWGTGGWQAAARVGIAF